MYAYLKNGYPSGHESACMISMGRYKDKNIVIKSIKSFEQIHKLKMT